MPLVSHDPQAPVKARSRRETPTLPLLTQGEEGRLYVGFTPAGFGSKGLMPSTVGVTDACPARPTGYGLNSPPPGGVILFSRNFFSSTGMPSGLPFRQSSSARDASTSKPRPGEF
jgi:hypothetical protein